MQERLQYLFQRYITNTCTRQELDEFFSLVRQDENNENIRQLVHELYDSIRKSDPSHTSVNERGQLIVQNHQWTTVAPAPVKSIKRRVLTIAASFLVLASISIGGWLIWKPAPNQTTLAALKSKTTRRSELKFMLLPDSSQVWLNASSTLSFPEAFNSEKREVFLSGEAFFDIKHADKIPFVIRTGNIATTVLGTAFNVKAYPDQKEVIVSVSRGKVKLTRDQKTLITLIKGEQAKVTHVGEGMVSRAVPEDEVAAWQGGNLVYDDETFAEILNDLERVFNLQVTLLNERVREMHISTSFKKEIGGAQALVVLCKLTDTELIKTADGFQIK